MSSVSKSRRVNLRLTEAEMTAVTEAAKVNGLTITALLVSRVMDASRPSVPAPKPTEPAPALNANDKLVLRNIGNNLNQMAHAINIAKCEDAPPVPLRDFNNRLSEVKGLFFKLTQVKLVKDAELLVAAHKLSKEQAEKNLCQTKAELRAANDKLAPTEAALADAKRRLREVADLALPMTVGLLGGNPTAKKIVLAATAGLP